MWRSIDQVVVLFGNELLFFTWSLISSRSPCPTPPAPPNPRTSSRPAIRSCRRIRTHPSMRLNQKERVNIRGYRGVTQQRCEVQSEARRVDQTKRAEEIPSRHTEPLLEKPPSCLLRSRANSPPESVRSLMSRAAPYGSPSERRSRRGVVMCGRDAAALPMHCSLICIISHR